ncbi:MAG: hypothetical protein ACLP8A_13580 [Methylovirgula sp.]
MKRRVVLTSFALIAAGFVWFCWYALAPITLRYRLTLTVDNNGQLVNGSSVVETNWWGLAERFPDLVALTGGHRWTITTRGEAVAVDLGSRGVLFALLRGDEDRRASWLAGDPAGFVTRTTGAFTNAGVTRDSLERVIQEHVKADVPFEKLPLLVRFREINDPATVEEVEPDNLAASFGPGVRLVRATVEITDDPVTTGIEKWLVWLPRFEANHASLDGDMSIARDVHAPLRNKLGSGEFKQGDLK